MKLNLKRSVTTAAITSLFVLAGCGGGSSSSDSDEFITLDDPNPPPTVAGTTLACDLTDGIVISTVAESLYPEAPDSIQAFNLSRETEDLVNLVPESQARPNVTNTILRLTPIVPPQLPDGTSAIDDTWTGEDMVHPVLVSYTEQVLGDYELGDGSADIGDPTNVDDAYVSISMDNGKSWKKVKVGDTAAIVGASYMTVSWDLNGDGVLEEIQYPGHSHKSTMQAWGDKVLVAWLDKYCPSGNPYDLELTEDGYPDDLYQVNGTQGSINYNLSCANVKADPTLEYGDLDYDCAPNGKEVYEVPFSCIWAARGVLVDPEEDGTFEIQWRKEEQLTSGRRDANKIWIASQDIGFAIAWQEDPEGLREGKGEGPGVGWSGATTNHGADIWYTHISLDDFDDVITEVDAEGNIVSTSDDPAVIAALATKPKPAVKVAYPVRVSDNEACFFSNDSKLYCEQVCTSSTLVESNNQRDDNIERCLTGDIDQLATFENQTLTYATLDGDTGASRPALAILKTNGTTEDGTPEYITILGYEETKGLSETEPGSDGETGTVTDIEVEGKMVYFESFPWDEPVTISAGNIINQPVLRFDPLTEEYSTDTNDLIFENARRLVLINQVDPCEMTPTAYTFGIMYKEGFTTQGDESDMFIRMNTGFTWDTFEDTVTCVSCQSTLAASPEEATLDNLDWTTDDLDGLSGDNPYDNNFSPRGFLRGDEIYTGFAYTVNYAQHESGLVPSNFWLNRYADDNDGGGLMWHGPQQITFEKGGVTAEDPRLAPTFRYLPTGLLSDQSNPNVWFMSYGTIDMVNDVALDVLYTRSTDKGRTWEYIDRGAAETPFDAAHLSTWPHPIEEKELAIAANPDGTMFFNVWVQESDPYDADGDGEIQNNEGLDSWMGRIDYTSADPTTLCSYSSLDGDVECLPLSQ